MWRKPSSMVPLHRLKKGTRVGKTKRGKGTKIMAIADRHGLPVAICIESATPHEVNLVVPTLIQMVIPEAPQNLIGDNAYDSDKLDTELSRYGIELIAPHHINRKNKTQDLRRLRRYRRRWRIERLFAWLQNFRRLVVRYERYAENFLGMLYLGCCVIRTTSEVFRCGIFACSSLFWRWCSLHSESSSWVERCRIFTETIFGHPQPAKNPWKRVRIVSRSTFAGNS